MVLKQSAAGRATNTNCQVIIIQPQQVPERLSGLQRERSQSHCKGAAHTAFSVGKAVHDSRISQRFSAPGGRHVDDECTMTVRAFTHGNGYVSGFVLPAKPFVF